ncbi:MAG: response regulator [Terriglobales bacterium]
MSFSAQILCVDDEASVLAIVKRLLESADFEVLTASCGREAIRVFKSEQIDVVLMDYWMTDMNGIDAATRMKQMDPNVPIVFLSAYSELPAESLGLAECWIRKGQEDPRQIIDLLRSLADRTISARVANAA